jgi:hypothetical protein
MATNWGGGGSKFKKTEFFKLGDGEQIFAILPAFGRLEEKGRWSMHYKVHFGYKNSEGKMKLFQSPLVKNKNSVIEAPDAALDRITALKAQYEEAKKTGNKELEERLAKLVGMRGQFNLDANHHMNAIQLDGKIGVLSIRHKAKVALDACMQTLIARNIDPGTRYYKFGRSGTGLDTTFTVSVYTKTVTTAEYGDVQKEEIFTLTPEILERMKTEARELDNIYPRLTSEEVARIVKEGAKAVDEIFGVKAKEESAKKSAAEAAPVAAPAVEAEPEYSEDYQEPVFATKPLAQTAVVLETKAVLAQPAAQAFAPALATISDDDFLASLNV